MVANEKIHASVRGSPQVFCDETGWRIGGHKAWLHVALGERASWYEVARTRDHTVLEGLIGADYAGTLIHDGWSVYDRFTEANHQQCVAHILRRARQLAASATRSASRFPRQIVEEVVRPRAGGAGPVSLRPHQRANHGFAGAGPNRPSARPS